MSDSLSSSEGQSSRIFVGNVAPDTDPDLIEQQFKTHGNVTGVAVHKGYCFVQYERPENAAKAIEKEAGSMFLGKRIDVKPANRGGGGSGPPELSASLQKAIDSLIKTGPNLLSGGSGAGPQTPASSASSDFYSAYGNRGGRGGY